MRKIVVFIIAAVFLANMILASPTALIGSASAAPLQSGYLEGFLKSTGATIEIEEYGGRTYAMILSPNASLQIDGVPVSLKDFQPGMEVYAKYSGGTIVYMEGYSTQNLGYIPPGSKVRSGVVKKIDRDQIVLKLPTGKEEMYFTSPATIALKKGLNVPLSTLFEGDSVRLYFDGTDSTIASRMEIQGDSVKIKGLYRGVLQTADTMGNELSLSDLEVLSDGTWKELAGMIKIGASRDMNIFYAGYAVPFNNLKYYKGKTVYIAVKDFFSSDSIERMVIKNQYETTYTDKIEEINWYADTFELSNKKNIDFNDGTIFIKSGRIVDKYSINPDSDALVVTDGRGDKNTADLVYIYNEDMNNSNIGQNYLYAGRLDEIIEDRVTLQDFFILNKNDWESFDDDKELYYDDDTYIYDCEEDEQISRKEFYSEDYAVDEDSDLDDWYAYIYADGDRIVAATVQEDMDSLLSQRVTTGTVETVVDDSTIGPTMTIRNAADWSSRNSKWMPKTGAVRIMLEDAMIIKDGIAISWEDIKPQDTVYAVRDDLDGKFVLVK